ncbi:bifunctional 3'-5' exonuclease/DNA polymerase [Actinocrinis sp.]|uniref:bifunctional 3'-5' exonuclease/DNA polymerase n=1 Tax=Actinocrinis sp. TaxID=1920516 RepID=UPI002C866C68|nr:bifunctional 3'-5' exonuclease/DNA polymerase [Actinocrinis sp.]HXR70299.1 bifunctional 3'-5' exonuclease/DNA polymerase [Actinocrinis sp.]
MRIAVTMDAAEPGDCGLSGWIQVLADDGTPVQPPQRADDLAATVAERERADTPRWVLGATETEYPRLLRAGIRVERCHDVALTEALLLGLAGRFGEPRSLAAAWARLRGLPVPEDPKPAGPEEQTALFGPGLFATSSGEPPDPRQELEMLVAVHADQLRRIAAAGTSEPRTATATTPRRSSAPSVSPPPALSTLVAAESAGGLVAAEIAASGLPWRVGAHDAVLSDLLGPRSFGDALPAKLAELGTRVGAAFGYPPGRFNPDSPNQVLRTLRHAGFSVQSTRAWELRQIDHPGIELLIEYKELSRLHAAHGWAWQDAWVKGGRYRPEYVVGGVVSGRWATRNSGALQIPRIMRRAVIADEGWSLVVADAGQLEPRVLAAVSGDRGLARAAAEGDLYAALAAEAFDGDRAAAKLALLGAMYGQTSGGIGPLLAVLRKRFPVAMAYVEDAARTGERGGVVYSRLGRACPPPSSRWRSLVTGMAGNADTEGAAGSGSSDAGQDPIGAADPDGPDEVAESGGGDPARRSGQAARSRGRFTRNFVIQASAADWALVWLAVLRRKLSELSAQAPPVTDGRPEAADRTAALFATAPHLVFFVHDEVVVHTPSALAEQAARVVAEAGEEARRAVFGPTPVRFPLATAIVDCYADAK